MSSNLDDLSPQELFEFNALREKLPVQRTSPRLSQKSESTSLRRSSPTQVTRTSPPSSPLRQQARAQQDPVDAAADAASNLYYLVGGVALVAVIGVGYWCVSTMQARRSQRREETEVSEVEPLDDLTLARELTRRREATVANSSHVAAARPRMVRSPVARK